MTSGLSDRRAASPPTAAPPAVRGGTSVDAVVLLATARSAEGGPAALLPWEHHTLVARLAGQLAALGVPRTIVLTRPAWEADVRAAVDTEVRTSPSLAADLELVAELAAAGHGGLVVMYGDMVTHGEALAGLLADPRVATGILAGGRGRPMVFRIRARRGRLTSAGSPYHSVHRPTAAFLGALKVAPADRPRLAAVARRLVPLAADPPASWRQELARKGESWRLGLARAAARDEGAADFDDTEGTLEDEPAEPEPVELSDEDEARLRHRLAAAPDDAAAVLLVGMVRDGATLTGSYVRRLFWTRPLSAKAAAEAEHDIAGIDEDRVLLDSAVKGSDGFFTTFFVSPYSKYIARWAARRGFTPNQVTTVSVLIGLVAAICFATGERWGLVVGAVLLQLSFTTDCVDGQLARYTRQFSKLGAWLDSVFDRTKEYLAFAGLAIGASAMGDPVWLLACAAITLQTVRHMSDFSFGGSQREAIGATPQPPVSAGAGQRGGGRRGASQQRRAGGSAGPALAARSRARRVARDRPCARRPLGQEDDRLPDRRAVRGDLDHRRVLRPARHLHRPARLGRPGDALHPDRPGAPVPAMSAAAVTAGAGPLAAAPDPIAVYRDDGPLARALGTLLGRALPLPGAPLIVLGLLPLLAAVIIGGGDTSRPVAAGVLAWVLLTAGASSGTRPRPRIHWAEPPLLRATEYIALIWIAALEGPDTYPAAFALLAALTFRHYDLVYRLRHRGVVPATWVNALSGGWDGRLIVAFLLLVAGALPAGYFVAAAVLGVAFVGEAVYGWLAIGRVHRPLAYEDEEDEGQ